MNIVLDCERMKYPNTGLYTFCEKLSSAMIRKVSVEDNLTLYIYPKTGHFQGNKVSYINRKFRDKFLSVNAPDSDIWHTTYQLSKYRGGGRNSKKVLTVHDLNFLYENPNQNLAKHYKDHQRRIDQSDYIVAISDFVKNDILTHLDVKDKPVITIRNGCEVLEFPTFNSPNYVPDRPFIFAIGTVLPKKNFHVLPAILAKNDFELIIAGICTEYSQKIMEEAKRFNVQDRVRILGPISVEEKYWYLKECTAFSFPSLAEGFGMPVVEAMHFGKPVFLSTLTSLPEIGGKEAYYFDNFEPESMQEIFEISMNDFVSNPQKAELIKQHANTFSWENTAASYYDVYKSLLK